MKLIIQIPCYNEERSLPVTLGNLPREVEGIDEVEWLVIDDGSSDETAEVARSHGAHVVAHTHNKGLARAFMTGLEESLRRGADIIVNTDADNQYDAACIPALIRPILEGKAEIVVGARPIELIEHFSFAKKMLQKLGSFVVRMASGTDIPDAPSGFRAISREAALRTNVFNDYTYTLETIIQAGQKNMAISSVPVRVNEDLRPSRLVKIIPSYIFRSLITITRIFVIYRPFYFCFIIGMCFFIPGFLLGLRFLYYLITENSSGHVQSLIFSSILIVVGFQTFILAFIADSISVNRKISEELQYIKRKIHLG
jgi:glycosyltransferase involved in cell wall biosynthesis